VDTDRLEAFSDGVFAIAITLLVLEIKVPPGEALGLGLLHLWPSYLAYGISFIVIGAIWINHHAMFDWIVRADHKLLLLNTLHLMFIAFFAVSDRGSGRGVPYAFRTRHRDCLLRRHTNGHWGVSDCNVAVRSITSRVAE
jgi:uncharacterized membrane protein